MTWPKDKPNNQNPKLTRTLICERAIKKHADYNLPKRWLKTRTKIMKQENFTNAIANQVNLVFKTQSQTETLIMETLLHLLFALPANGLRYPQVGGRR